MGTDWISEGVAKFRERMIGWRRDFHRRPELGMEEHETARSVAGILADFGLTVRTGVGRTGVVAVVEGGRPGPTILLRADMDALPIDEATGAEYASGAPGVMHACGHDGHMAILLAAAGILAGHKDRLTGRVKLVFQPGEEGFGGARLMIEDGVLDDPPVQAALALHLLAHQPVGTIGVRTGTVMAAADWFHARFIGQGGHAAMPESGVDAVYLAAQAIVALQSLVSKETSPLAPYVIHVGTIHGGRKFNVIADTVDVSGTVRALDENLRAQTPGRMDRLFSGLTAALGGRYELDYSKGYPPVVNDDAMTDLVRTAAEQVVGPARTLDLPPSMGADDMAFFLEKVPGCYFWVGAANQDKGINHPHHHSRFEIDEDALAVGAQVMLRAAVAWLNNGQDR
jgi:amidohydrolase